MRRSHTSSNINPRTPDHRTSKSHSWTNGKTPRDHKSDPGMQIKKLLPRISKMNQTMGNVKTASITKESTAAKSERK